MLKKIFYKEIKDYNDQISDKLNLISDAKLEGFKPFLFEIKPYSLKFILDKENNSNEIKLSEARLKNDIDYEKLYDIIVEIKKNDLMISEEDLIIKFDEIQKILYIHRIIDSIFDDNYGEKRTKEKDKEIGETLETEEQKLENIKNYFGSGNVFRIAFIKYLNNKRVLGNLCINKKASKMLGSILLVFYLI